MDKAQEVQRRLESLKNLPTLPAVIDKLRAAVRDPNSSATQVAKIIEDDPSMMARILKIVNSALYASWEPTVSVELAVARLGFSAVTNIATSTAVFQTFGKDGEADFDREAFWRHCVSVGIGVNVLYERCKPNLQRRYGKDLMHLAGLLHDVGKIVLEPHFHASFVAAVRAAGEKRLPLAQAEVEELGTDHAEVGAWLAMRWNQPPEVLQAVRWHHHPGMADVEHQELVMLVHSANHICNLEKIGDGGDTVAPTFHQATWTRLGLTVKDIPVIVDEVVERSKESEVLMTLL
jgi:HD-like signal output (HDOD) protein